MKKAIAILQSNYIPWKGYFDLINSVDEFWIFDGWQYTRNDWRNRNKVKTHNGPIWLTIPVLSKSTEGKMPLINEVETKGNQWRKKHWRTVNEAYTGAEYFSTYREILEELYLNSDERNLSKINKAFIDTIVDLLKIETKVQILPSIDLTLSKSERLAQVCLEREATVYLSGQAARNYLEPSAFDKHGIEIVWMDYSDYKEYAQCYPPFVHEISIIDLLLNTGTGANSYLKSFEPGWRRKLGTI